MTKISLSSERNVENIRRKNLEDNQLFLQNLLITKIRNDFVNSARSILHKDTSSQVKKKLAHQHQKVEYVTRYREKVKSGEIDSFVPEWQRQIDEKKKTAEERLLEKERKKVENEMKRLLQKERKKQEYEMKREESLFQNELRKIERKLIMEEQVKIILANRPPRNPSKWVSLYKNSNNGNPYERTFKPRVTKVGKRTEQNLL